jgi:hypothetical protein
MLLSSGSLNPGASAFTAACCRELQSIALEYCPFCRTAVNMIATVTPKAIARKSDTMKTISTKTYHCGSCGSFVRRRRMGSDLKIEM